MIFFLKVTELLIYRDFQNPCNIIRPQNSVTSLYGRFRVEKLPYKEVTEI